ncbi:hypothetical protein GCM10010339_91220 [Streptomyces alanosinicus]|uniref:Uncharacterized protein n=1 Tax=Streptomyces alanosinicus TaxID=68171 RepID=A0A918YTH9_9ACTN|nr:hypothetical protein GCM10010339_91220 [Streptomyces alanosinicus]
MTDFHHAHTVDDVPRHATRHEEDIEGKAHGGKAHGMQGRGRASGSVRVFGGRGVESRWQGCACGRWARR